jgi:hypothetical protein
LSISRISLYGRTAPRRFERSQQCLQTHFDGLSASRTCELPRDCSCIMGNSEVMEADPYCSGYHISHAIRVQPTKFHFPSLCTISKNGVAEVASAYYGQFLPMARTSVARRLVARADAAGPRGGRSSAILPPRIGCECPNNGLSPITRQGLENLLHQATSGLVSLAGTDAS